MKILEELYYCREISRFKFLSIIWFAKLTSDVVCDWATAQYEQEMLDKKKGRTVEGDQIENTTK